jgi:hypothetical protein
MKGNNIVIGGEIANVSLNRGYTAIIDAADVEMVSRYTWCAAESKRADGSVRTVYVVTSIAKEDGKRAGLRLHRLLTNAPEDKEVDHINGDALDNKRSNLRVVTGGLNNYNMRLSTRNKSGYKGVFFCRPMWKWATSISVEKKPWVIGYFDNPIDAAKLYDEAARRFFGKFACLNFPGPGEQGARNIA